MQIAKIALLWAASAACLALMLALIHAGACLEAIGKTATEIPAEIRHASDGLTEVADARAAAATRLADSRIASIQRDLRGSVEDLSIRIDARAGELTASASRVASSAASAADEARRTADLAGKMAASMTSTSDALRPEIVGTARDVRFAAAEIGRTAGTIQRAAPEITDGVKQIVKNSNEAAARDVELHKAAIAVAENLKEDTKPRSLWVRLAVTAALSATRIFY